MSDEWGPWIEHDGRGCPVKVGQFIEVEYWIGCRNRDGRTECGTVDSAICAATNWRWAPVPWLVNDVIRYRIRRPPALRALVDLVEALPAQPRPAPVEPAGPLEVA